MFQVPSGRAFGSTEQQMASAAWGEERVAET